MNTTLQYIRLQTTNRRRTKDKQTKEEGRKERIKGNINNLKKRDWKRIKGKCRNREKHTRKKRLVER